LAKRDNKKIGESAVVCLAHAFRNVGNVLTHFDVNDTGVCDDGNIEVYSGYSMSKENLHGMIPVQIKGTTSKPAQKASQKYKVSVTDLRKYLDVYAGVLYFVVFLDPNLNLRGIYYKQYLPYDIQMALRGLVNDDQKTLTDVFRPLPNDARQLERLCLEFVSNAKKQRGTDVIGYLSPEDEDSKNIRFERCEFTKTYYPGESPFSLKPYETGAYLYGTTSSGMRYVIDKLESIVSVQASSPHLLSAGDFSAVYDVVVGEDEAGDYILLGGISLRFGNPPTFTYRDRGGFRARLRDARLVREIVRSRVLHIDGKPLAKLNEDEGSVFRDLDERISRYEGYVSLMDRLSIVPDWNPSDLSGRELWQLDQLASAFLDGRHVKVDEHQETSIVFDIKVSGASLKIVGSLKDDGKYAFYNAASADLVFAAELNSGECIDTDNPLPCLLSFSRSDLESCANISAEQLGLALKRCPLTKANSGFATLKLLDMLNAYDNGAVCRSELLKCCNLIADALLNLNPEAEENPINKAQISYREGHLSENEEDALRSLSILSSSMEVKAAAYILLDQYDLADACIAKLQEDELERFKSWPIFHLRDSERSPRKDL